MKGWAVMKNPHKVLPQLLAATIGSWGFFCTGTVRGWSSPGIPSINATKNFDIESDDLQWIAALPPLCAFFGALCVSFPLQYFGRRKTLIYLCIPFVFGFLLMGLTYWIKHKAALYVGRIMSGLMTGATSPSSQIYISECSSPRVRGTLSSLTASAMALGILVAYVIGAFVPWHVLALIQILFPLMMFTGMIFMPETPSWLVSKGKEEEALKALRRLRGKRTNVDAEFERIKNNAALGSKKEEVHFRDIFKGPVFKPLLVSMSIMFFQQFTGINAMVFHTVSIFQDAGSTIDGRYATIIVGIVQLLATISSGFMVDRFGRRVLLICSGSVICISLAAMGTFFYFQSVWGRAQATASLGWLPLLSLIVFIVAYSGGFANVPFILMGELFPLRYRSVLGPMSSSFNLICTFTVVRTFKMMQDTMTKYGAYWFFMCCTLLSIAFVYLLLPETKGKSLEEIEKLFSGKKKDRIVIENFTPDKKEGALQMAVIQLPELEKKGNCNDQGVLDQQLAHHGQKHCYVSSGLNVIDSEDEEDEPEVVHIPAA